MEKQIENLENLIESAWERKILQNQNVKLCSRVAVVVSKYVHEWDIPLLPSNVIDFVMLSALMVLMFFRLAGKVCFPRVTGMSRRQGIN